MKRILCLVLGLLAAQCEASMVALLSGSPPSSMVTPVFVYGGAPASVDNTTTEYAQFSGAAQAWGAVGQANTPMPIDGRVGNLRVVLETAPGSGKSWTYTLYKNSVATALTVTISDAATSASDTTNTVSFVAGDLLAWAAIPTNTPDVPTNLLISCAVTGSNKQSFFTGGDASTASNSVNSYRGMWAGGTWSLTESTYSTLMPTSGTLDKLYVVLNNTPGGSATYTFTVYKNGSPTGITCTVASAATTASDLSNSIAFLAGDTISIASVPSGTPSARTARFGLRMQPDTNGESIHGMGASTFSASAVRYGRLDSLPITAVVATPTTAIASIMPVAATLKHLYFSLETAPGSGKSRLLTSYINAGAGSLSANIADTATTANDTTHSDSVSEGDSVWLVTTPTGTTDASAWLKGSLVISVP